MVDSERTTRSAKASADPSTALRVGPEQSRGAERGSAKPLGERPRTNASAARLLDCFATLLDYPAAPVADACAATLAECAALDPRTGVYVAAFTSTAAHMSLAELQELYSRTFDFDADAALYVGHQLFGEDGRRGLLIAGLVERYRTLGIDPGTELADHFPPVLRSLTADATSDEARDLVRYGLRPAISKVVPTLERRAPAYAALLTALASVLDQQAGTDPLVGSDAWTSSSSLSFLTLRS